MAFLYSFADLLKEIISSMCFNPSSCAQRPVVGSWVCPMWRSWRRRRRLSRNKKRSPSADMWLPYVLALCLKSLRLYQANDAASMATTNIKHMCDRISELKQQLAATKAELDRYKKMAGPGCKVGAPQSLPQRKNKCRMQIHYQELQLTLRLNKVEYGFWMLLA